MNRMFSNHTKKVMQKMLKLDTLELIGVAKLLGVNMWPAPKPPMPPESYEEFFVRTIKAYTEASKPRQKKIWQLLRDLTRGSD